MEYPIIAEFKMPKQRMTRHFGFVMMDRGGTRDDRYSIHTKYYDNNTYEYGYYALTWQQAHELFAKKVKNCLDNYPHTVYELHEMEGA